MNRLDIEALFVEELRLLSGEVLVTLPSDGLEKFPLLGPLSTVDSLSLLTILVAFEEALKRKFGLDLDLLSEEFLTGSEESPVENVARLASYVANEFTYAPNKREVPHVIVSA